MASLFKIRGLGKSKGEVGSSRSPVADLPFPFRELGCNLSDSELRETAYEMSIGACWPSCGKPMTHASQSDKGIAEKMERSMSVSQQRSLSSTAASKMKNALGLKSLKKSPGKESGSPGLKRLVIVGELMRVQMKIS